MAEKKEKRYVIDNAKLMTEWNWEKNNELGLDTNKLTCCSGIKVWWKCSKGHEWQSTIANRSYGNDCPYCSGKKALKGYNDLETVSPALAKEWNYEKNGDLKPENCTVGSNIKVWWKCSKGHEWQASIHNRNKDRGCPYCAGRYSIKGKNDLQTINPTLAKEWDYEKNNRLTPADVLPNSNKKVWWKCDKGHEWQAVIASRNIGVGCPYCSGKKALKGYNDLETVSPALAKEWNYEKNGDLKPENCTVGSNKKVWWKCSKGHEWQAKINNRNKGNGCPFCNSEHNTSLPEYIIAFYLKKYGFEIIHSYKELGYELDIYIPSKKIAIEYDGGYWHENKTIKDLEKNNKCEKDGIKLYRIREGMLPLNDSSIDFIVQKDQKDLSEIIRKALCEITGIDIDVNLKRDMIAIAELREYIEKENSLLFLNPKVAKEWNDKKNGNLKPKNFEANSSKKVWWICDKGHEWQATISHRNNGRNCPYCSGKKTLKGYNDLETVSPALAKEWNYEKNGNLKPENCTVGSNKKVWWKCSKGHEWQAIIADRNNGSKCPYCSGKKALKGYNDLQTVNPTLAKEWNYKKNGNLKPENFTASSNKKAWWICKNGHQWEAVISSRNNGNGCPYCSNQKVLKDYNDLKTINPSLAKEWNYDRNDDLTPMDVVPGSEKKVWWKCEKGHEWEAIINSRNKGSGCPFCYRERRCKSSGN